VSDKFALIAAEQADDHEQQLPVGLMCRALRVSRSGFYDWARAEPSARAARRAKLAVHVKAAFILGRGTYGVRRVHAVLTHSDDSEVASVSLDLVRNLMQENDLHASSRAPTRSPPSPGLPLRRPSPTT
jgi:putative transposase